MEVALTLDRVGDYRAVLADARDRFGRRARIGRGEVGLIGSSRGAVQGLVGSELLLSERASIRDHFVREPFARFIPGPGESAVPSDAPAENPFGDVGVGVEVNAPAADCD